MKKKNQTTRKHFCKNTKEIKDTKIKVDIWQDEKKAKKKHEI